MRCRSRCDPAASERGSVTAELAVAMPTVFIVLMICLSGIQAGALQIRLQDAAAIAARASARGDEAWTQALSAMVPDASVDAYSSGELRCARVTSPAEGALAMTGLRLEASSCALGSGR